MQSIHRDAGLRTGLALAPVLALLAGLHPAAAQPAAPAPRADKIPGYLTSAQMPDAVLFLGPPPADGSGSKAGDVETFRATRGLEGSPRWALAARDDVSGPAPMMAHFSCAVGVAMTPRSAPALLHLFLRLNADASLSINSAKAAFKRPRPFVEKGGKTCLEDPQERDQTAKTYSYPSGHSTYSWLTGLVLSMVAPDRATDVLARARSYGESRVVCGVHYESDVQAGRAAASGLFAAEQASSDFQSDVRAAGTELAALRTHPDAPDPAECAIEAKAAAEPVW
jgi:acid phosphatase (class A)